MTDRWTHGYLRVPTNERAAARVSAIRPQAFNMHLDLPGRNHSLLPLISTGNAYDRSIVPLGGLGKSLEMPTEMDATKRRGMSNAVCASALLCIACLGSAAILTYGILSVTSVARDAQMSVAPLVARADTIMARTSRMSESLEGILNETAAASHASIPHMQHMVESSGQMIDTLSQFAQAPTMTLQMGSGSKPAVAGAGSPTVVSHNNLPSYPRVGNVAR